MGFASIEEKVIYEKLTAHLATTPEQADKRDGQSEHLALIDEIAKNIYILEQTRESSSFKPLLSKRRFIGRFVIFIKKVIRKLTSWYVEPVCKQQSLFNSAVTPSIGRLTEISRVHIDKFDLLAKRIEQMQLMIQDGHKRIHEGQQQIQDGVRARNEMQQEIDEKNQQLLIANEQILRINGKLEQLEQLDLNLFTPDPKLDASYAAVQRVGVFSQAGEDMIIHFLLHALGIPPEKITYLDLGANRAMQLNNTFHFYKRGARGVLVEANPALIPELKFFRHGDIVLNLCIAPEKGSALDFYVLSGDGLSTTSKEDAENIIATNPALTIERIVSVQADTVSHVIDTYLGKTPTLLNIDIEGSEMEILRSLDFDKYRPLVIILEMVPYTFPYAVAAKNQEMMDFMTSVGYHEYAFSGINAIFVDAHQLKEMGRYQL